METERIVNRHIAKLLSRLKVLKLPEIAESEIKRQIWFCANDLSALYQEQLQSVIKSVEK
jgi:hypothetical protein